MKSIYVALLAGTLVCSTAALAATQSGTAQNKNAKMLTMRQADKNKDGYISRSEAEASVALTKQFDALDTNHDGRLSAAEYAKHK